VSWNPNRYLPKALSVPVLVLAFAAASLAQTPTVSGISPASGPAVGGTAVTITGTNFVTGAAVSFGAAAATNVTVVNSTTITATTPANAAGAANVTVTNPNLQTGTLWAVQQPLTNPGFEATPLGTGWVQNGAGTAQTITNSAQAHSGNNFAQLSVVAPNTQVSYIALLNGTSEYLPVNPGDVINFGGWAYRADTNTGDGLARWQIEVTTANGLSYQAAIPNNVTTASWVQQQNTYTVPGGATKIRFWCQITGVNGSVSAQANFDDAALTRTVPGGGFTFVGAPVLSAISPSSGLISGGTAVSLTGSNFQNGATVTFGGTSATNVTVVNSTSITATTPAGSTGAVNVTVTNPDGQFSTVNGGFTYIDPPPALSSISPTSGTSNGGTTVTLTGANFQTGATVTFGSSAATNVTVVNATTITATTPADPSGGAVNVTVTNPDTQAATLYAVEQPLTNPGFELGTTGWTVSGYGTAVVLTNPTLAHSGNNYAQLTVNPPNTQVNYIATLSGTSEYLPVSPGDIITYGGWVYRVDTNPGDGLARWQIEVTDINKTNPSYQAASPNNVTTATWVQEQNTYTVPSGKAYVRFWCQITGTNGAVQAQANCDDATFTVTIPGGGFTYILPPTLASISPTGGALAGGTTVTLSGLNFLPGATVMFGSAAATNVVVVSSTTITATTPANSAGPVNVTVTNPGGQQSILTLGYTYNPAPTITAVAPTSGPVAGGTSTTITGSNFLTGATVKFGAAAASNVTVVTPSQIAATTPAGSPGPANVVVTNPDNQSATLTNGYTFMGLPPAISYIAPTNGTMNGGTSVNIHGSNFQTGATVTVGGVPLTLTQPVGSTLIVGTTGAHVAGGADVVVTNVDTQTTTLSATLYNQGFESGNTLWAVSGKETATIVNCSSTGCASGQNNAHNGMWYAELSSTGTKSQPSLFVANSSGSPIYFPVLPGDVITFGGWAYRVSGNGNARWSIEITDQNKQNPNYYSAPPANVQDPQWELQEGTYTVPSGKAFIRLYCEIEGATVASVARFDDAVLQRSPEGTQGYTYNSTPWLNSISPNWGVPAGGTTRTVWGTGFQNGSTVIVGGVAGTNVVVNSANAITFFVPPNSAGTANVVVTGPDLQPSNTLTNAYTYETPPAPPTGMTQIQHIIYTLQENRAFDHYFGQMEAYRQNNGITTDSPLVNGLLSPPSLTRLTDIAGQKIPMFHLQTECEENLQPSWNAQHIDYDNGNMDDFMLTGNMFSTSSIIDPNGTRAGGYYDWTDIPYYYSLAFQFATSDSWFSSAMANTGANRSYVVAGTSLGSVGTPTPPTGGFPNLTIFDLLDQAGVTWRYYYQDSSPIWIPIWSVYFKDTANIVPIANYYNDVQNASTFPQVVFIEENGSMDEHPKPNPGASGATGSIQLGANLTSGIVDALLNSPTWASSVLILTYDEAGGTYDHVAPPTNQAIPDGYPPMTDPGTDQPGIFNQFGMRVPLMVVSPWTIPHFVSHINRDHTSILKFIETRFSLPPLTARDAAADNMIEFFEPNFGSTPWLTPPTVSSSCNPGTGACLVTQPTNGVCNLNLETAPGQ
jgi:phospholipase C